MINTRFDVDYTSVPYGVELLSELYLAHRPPSSSRTVSAIAATVVFRASVLYCFQTSLELAVGSHNTVGERVRYSNGQLVASLRFCIYDNPDYF